MQADKETPEVRSMHDGSWCWMSKAVIFENARKIKPIAIAVYSLLAALANRQQRCFPSQKYLVSILGCSRSTVSRALMLLEVSRLILREKISPHQTVYYLLKTSSHVSPVKRACIADAHRMLQKRYTNKNNRTRIITNNGVKKH